MRRIASRTSSRRLSGIALIACVSLAATPLAQASTSSSTTGTAKTGTGKIALTALSFSPTSVDATSGSASVTLDWTVTDSSAAATYVDGDVAVAQVSANGKTVGPTYNVGYSLDPYDLPDGVVVSSTSGTAQSSDYSYSFAVPQYTAATSAKWAVVSFTGADDQSDSASLGQNTLARKFGASSFTATEDVDTVGVTYNSLELLPSYNSAYNDATAPVNLAYNLGLADTDSGFWKGTLVLGGPGNRRISTDFAFQYNADGTTSCANGTAFYGWFFADQNVNCEIPVTIPKGAAAGTWTVTSLELTDAAGQTKDYTGLDAAPVQLTQNKVLTASGFALSESTFNNWGQVAQYKLNLTPQGVRDGVKFATAVESPTNCSSPGITDPTPDANGQISIPLYTSPTYATSCTVTGILVEDGAGDVAAYGSAYQGPALTGLTATQIPDTAAPTVTSASLNETTVSESNPPNALNITVNYTAIAGVAQGSSDIYNSAGVGGQDGYGGLGGAPGTGTVQIEIPWNANTAPGTYTIGFTLTDYNNLTSSYGGPGQAPIPSGPLTVTVTQ